MEMNQLVQQLRTGRHTLVVADGGSVFTFDGRGVADLYRLWTEQPAVLRGASVADKVVGKGAAALMIAGGVREVYAEVVSEAACELFGQSAVQLTYGLRVPHIINRAGTGRCPLETLCEPCATVADCLPVIERFVKGMAGKG